MDVNGSYKHELYYFHSTVYRFLCVFAWIKKINKEIFFLDTTIATKEDLDFIKFLKVFSNVFCDLTFIVEENADGNYAIDHFFKLHFELFPDSIVSTEGINSFSEYEKKLPVVCDQLNQLYIFFDGITPKENRMRWDRLHLMHLTLILFLNCYGYDFQQTSNEKIIKILTIPKTSKYLKNYFNFMIEYKLEKNKAVKNLLKISNGI